MLFTALALYMITLPSRAEPPLVYPNDAISLEAIKQLVLEGQVHCIVISPGPGTPEHASDIGAGRLQMHTEILWELCTHEDKWMIWAHQGNASRQTRIMY